MALAVVIILLIAYGIYALVKASQPANPPIDDMSEHLKTIQSLPNQKARQKYLKDLAKKKNKK